MKHYLLMRQASCIICLLFFTCLINDAQDRRAFKQQFLEAEHLFMNEDYHQAVHVYGDLLESDPENANLQFLIGACYLSMYGEKKKSIPYLEYASRHLSPSYREGSYKERSAPREALFALARAYHINHDFDLAAEVYESYRDVMIKREFADVEYVNHQIKSCDIAEGMILEPREVQYLRMAEAVNRSPSNHQPVASLDDSTLIYLSGEAGRESIMMIRRMGNAWGEARNITSQLNPEGPVLPSCLSRDGSELYLVRLDPYDPDIFISYRKNNRWTPMVPLNEHVNSGYAETHAFVTTNGKHLYFTSNRPGGQGGLDIWVSETTTEGDWGPAVNLGPRINSHYNEETPFLTENSALLYFSSQGHATMGGYDVFKSERILDHGNGALAEISETWSFPQNLGYPLSTPDDDLFFVPRRNGRRAYCAAKIDTIDPRRLIYALQLSSSTQLTIAARRAGVEIQEVDAGLHRRRPPDPVGTSERMDPPGTGARDLPAHDSMPPGAVDPDEYYVLNSIFFDFDSDELDEAAMADADRVRSVMVRQEGLRLQLTGHTDEVGSDEYNLNLSKRRAQAVADYLISEGIDASRIRVRGVGETTPIAINRYEDGTDSPEGRRLNRHVSLKFEGLQSASIKVEEVFVPDELRPLRDQTFSVLLVNSETMRPDVPDTVLGQQTALIITDSAFLYMAGRFDRKFEAIEYLNEVIDRGYPDAGMMERRTLEHLIESLSAEGISVSATFTIQIMALENPVDVSYFKPLLKVNMYAGSDGLHRYVYGEFEDIDAAMQRLPELKAMGYHDAFIMSLLRYTGQR